MLKLFMLIAALVLARPAWAVDDLIDKQLTMFAAEAQFYSTLAKQQKDEIEKLKATGCEAQPSMKPGESK